MSIGFSDLDNDLQRSVFAAVAILSLVLGLAIVQIVNYILLGLCVVATFYLAYKLFLEPKLHKTKEK